MGAGPGGGAPLARIHRRAGPPPLRDSLRWRLAHDLQNLVAEREADGSLVGWFSAYGYSAAAESCEFTVCVPPGTGRRAGEGIVGIWMFLDYLFFGLTVPVRRVQAVVYAYNLRSQQVLSKGGFVREGAIRDGHYVGGRHHEICFMGLVCEAWEAYRKRTGIDAFLDRSGAPRT